ncbi:MAG TPA: ABC transporter permease [Rhodanobacteraceae bacterium]
MNSWYRALHAEILKLKHTMALRLVVLIPVGIALLIIAQYISIAHYMPGHHAHTAAKAWFSLGRSTFVFWCLLMLPLFVTLETALLAGLEHNNRQWKHLEALALPRNAHYFGKWSMAVLMVICAHLILLALIPVAGWVLMFAAPTLGIAGVPALGPLVGPVAGSMLASLLMISLQMWVALHWRSFSVAVSVGIFAMVAGFLIGRSHTWGKFYPWSMPMQVFGKDAHNMTVAIWLGSVAGIVVALIGLYDYLRRDTA